MHRARRGLLVLVSVVGCSALGLWHCGSSDGAAGGETTAAACQDGQDNDGDELIDCLDSDCAGFVFCAGGGESDAASCQDGKDNDGDGDIDCADSGCKGFTFCGGEDNTALCQDGKDNDGNQLTDCDDPSCQAFVFCQQGREDTAGACGDGKDNDGDGDIDCKDSDCLGFVSCAGTTELTVQDCSDSKDNDGDGKVDCNDPDCQVYTVCIGSQEQIAVACSDGKDNDGDNKTDCEDEDCQSFSFCAAPDESTAIACSDKKDNDGDSKIDCADEDCKLFSFCSATGESSQAECQDGNDNDSDGAKDCADSDCWSWYFCGHYNGFPATDGWGAIWDGIARGALNYADAKATCEGKQGRLPTVTELHRNNAASGSSAISGPGATEYLWTRISTYQAGQKALVRLNDGNTSNADEATVHNYRCIWDNIGAQPGFNASRCHGTPGSTCAKVDDRQNIDNQDRPELDYAAAVNECAFYDASIPSLADWSELLQRGAVTAGSAQWLWASNAMYWYNQGHGHAVIKFDGDPKPSWYFLKTTFGGVSAITDKRAFRCIGLAKPDDFPAPTPTCTGGCLTATARRSTLVADGDDRTATNYKAAYGVCRAAGGELPNLAELTELTHEGWDNGSDAWLWLSDALYWYNGGYGHPVARWSGPADDHWVYSGWGTLASLSGGATDRPYRCVYRPKLPALPSCQAGQVIEQGSGGLACVAGQAGSSGGKASGSEATDDWSSAWDGSERAAQTYADAKTACEADGARLPTASELYRVRATGNPHGTVGAATDVNYLWSSSPSTTVGNRFSARISDGGTKSVAENTTAPFRCIWPAKASDVLHGANCYGPPGGECFSTSDGMVADVYDRPLVDVPAAQAECRAVGGKLPDARELTRLIHQGLPNGSNAWLWLDESMYWYSGNYGYALGRWTGVGTSNWDYETGSGAVSVGGTPRNFRCIYSPYLR